MKMNETIRSRRKELNLTQEQMADFLGVTAPAVHKWEKGITYPDISLLPALARLLGVDLNTLFSFEQELTEQEINMFSGEVVQLMQKKGFEAGYERAMMKIREFPNCALLLCSVAAVLDGCLVLFLVEDTARFEEAIENLYERAAKLGDARVREQANQMLILKYMKRKDFDKAEQLLDTLPDAPVDKQNLRATLLVNKSRNEEAVRVLEEKLWYHTNSVQNTLLTLLNCFQRLEKEEMAELCAKKSKEITVSFGLWEYGMYLADYQMAIYRKDREHTLSALRRMLQSLRDYCKIPEFPLYEGIQKQEKEESVQGLMTSSIVEALRRGDGLDEEGFLQGDPELGKILEEFGEAADGCQEGRSSWKRK